MSFYGTLMAVSARERERSFSLVPPPSSSPNNPLITPAHSNGNSESEDEAPRGYPVRPPSRIEPIHRDSALQQHNLLDWLPPSHDGLGRIGISPHNRLVQAFDFILCLSLIYTATVAVFVVCVAMTQPAKPGRHHGTVTSQFSPTDHPIWSAVGTTIDSVLDAVFLTDFVLGFFRAFRLDGGRGRMVFELKEIRHLYVSHPAFVLDFLSSLPFPVMVLVLGTLFNLEAHSLRFLRLIRLMRVHRAYSIIDQSRTYQAFTLRVDSKKLHMAQLVMGLLLVEHWASCWWVWLGREEVLLNADRYTWIDRLEENGFLFNRTSELELYIIGVYWASTVSTSVGSGDVVPANPQEAMFVAVFQILGGCMFAYAVSSLVGLYAALHVIEEGRGRAIDSVNEMLMELTQENSPVDVDKIRTFVWLACDARAARARRRLAPGGAMSQLSPQLRDEVFLAERQKWMDLIWFLKHIQPKLARVICREAKWVTYAPGDFVTLTTDQCVVFTRGVATTRHLVLVRGCVLGAEGLATVPRPGKGPCFLCISFVEALMFESANVNRAVRSHGDKYEQKRLLKARARYGLLRWANRVKSVVDEESEQLAYSMFRM